MVYGSVSMFGTPGQHDVVRGSRISAVDRPVGAVPSPMPANDWQGQGWTFWQFINTAHVARHHDRRGSRPLRRHEAPRRATIASLTAQPGVGGSIADASGRLACAANNSCTELFSPNDTDRTDGDPEARVRVRRPGAAPVLSPAHDVLADRARRADRDGDVQPPLRVHVQGGVGGRVTSSPAGIACPGTCSATFAPGAGVTLHGRSRLVGRHVVGRLRRDATRTAAPSRWTQPRNVTATFADLGPATATIKPPRTRHGAVRGRFDEPVRHVTDGQCWCARWRREARCASDVLGHRAQATPCDGGGIRSAQLQPTVHSAGPYLRRDRRPGRRRADPRPYGQRHPADEDDPRF